MQKIMEQFSVQVRRSDPREAATDLYCTILLCLFPLFPGFSGYTNITFSKYVFLLAATALWLVALLVLTLRRRLPLPRFGTAQLAALAFLLLSVLSALISPWFPETVLGAGRWDGLLTTAVYCSIFLGVSLFTRPKPLHIYALGLAVTLCCAVALLQLLGRNPLGLYPDGLRYADAGVRYSGVYLGTIGNTNLLDAVLCLAVPLCVCEILKRRFLFLIPYALSVVVLAKAGGSGAALALACFVLAALLILPRGRTARIVCAALAALLALAALFILRFWRGTEGALYEISQVLRGHVEDSFGSSRIRIWRECLALFPQRPLLGGGPGTVASRLSIEFSRFVPETGATLRSYADNAHNVYLGYLVNVGVLGLASYLSLLVLALLCGLRRGRRSSLPRMLVLSVLCGAVHAFFGLGLCLTEPLFFALLGLCATVDPPQRAAKGALRLPSARTAAVTAALVVLIAALAIARTPAPAPAEAAPSAEPSPAATLPATPSPVVTPPSAEPSAPSAAESPAPSPAPSTQPPAITPPAVSAASGSEIILEPVMPATGSDAD